MRNTVRKWSLHWKSDYSKFRKRWVGLCLRRIEMAQRHELQRLQGKRQCATTCDRLIVDQLLSGKYMSRDAFDAALSRLLPEHLQLLVCLGRPLLWRNRQHQLYLKSCTCFGYYTSTGTMSECWQGVRVETRRQGSWLTGRSALSRRHTKSHIACRPSF
jgi:hypothetical protein